MHRTLPATEQIHQVDHRIRDLKENVIENIKNSQILRSNFTTLMHLNKEANEILKSEILDCLAELRKEFEINYENQAESIKEMEKESNAIYDERRVIADNILLLDNRVKVLEGIFGCFTVEDPES